MPIVRVQDLVPGQTVASDVVNVHGQVILPAQTVLGPRHRTLLKAWGIVEILVRDDSGPREAAQSSSSSPQTSNTAVPPAEAGQAPDKPATLPFTVDENTHPLLVELSAVMARLRPKGAADCGALLSAPTAAPSAHKGRRPDWMPVTPETVAGRARTLVSLPTIYFQVDRAINHPTSSSADIANALRCDQGLCARLLRIANSAFYGFPQRVESVDQAIRVIGTRQLHDLVLATVVLTQFRGVDARLVNMKSFWQHSFACGIAARSFAALRRESNGERFFVAGLLHDIGSLVLYQGFPERARAALEEHRSTGSPLDEVERSIIGCDHGQVGAALMSSWKLPEFYREVAANHHCPSARSPSVGTAIVHLADLLVVALALGSNGEATLPGFSPESWKVLDLPPSCLGRVAEEALGLVEETLRLFTGD